MQACADATIEPALVPEREFNHLPWQERFGDPLTPAPTADVLARMKHRLEALDGRVLYGLRKQTVEPVLGNVGSMVGFRQFLLRGLDEVRAEWSLVTTGFSRPRWMQYTPFPLTAQQAYARSTDAHTEALGNN